MVGIDFSGAALSGKTAWAAELEAAELEAAELEAANSPPDHTTTAFRLVSLHPLGRLAGGDERETINRYLVDRISADSKTFWGCDFPFGLPLELDLGCWEDQLSHVSEFSGSAKGFGLSLVERTEQRLGTKHVRRQTDRETQTPFDCYHYRIIYQTFHGMRDVLAKIADKPDVAVLPFQYAKLGKKTRSVVVEACPSSTLKRLHLPHQRYKQSGGKPPDDVHKQTRRRILARIKQHVEISPHRRKVIMNDPGGDALDAVLAGLGAWLGAASTDHQAVARHERYSSEGRVYC